MLEIWFLKLIERDRHNQHQHPPPSAPHLDNLAVEIGVIVWVPLVNAQQLLVQAPLYLIWFIFNNISTTTTIIVIFISIYISWASPTNRQKRYYLPWPRYEPGSKSSGTGSHSGGISGTEMGWVIRIRSNSWIKSTFNKYKKNMQKCFHHLIFWIKSYLLPSKQPPSGGCKHNQSEMSHCIGTCIRNGGSTAICAHDWIWWICQTTNCGWVGMR